MTSFLASALDKVFEFGKQIALFSLLVLALVVIGNVIAGYFDFTFLTSFMVLVRRLAMLFNFAFDIPTLFNLLFITLDILVSYWSFIAVLFVVRFFNNNNTN